MIDRDARLLNKAAQSETAPDVHPGLRGDAAMTIRPGFRRGFTLIELLVAVGILVLLAGILLPAISHVYNQAQLQAQSLEFQTIASALENYNKDFHAYPSNSSLPTWAISNATINPGLTGTGPHFLSLALALLGPGPVAAGPVGKDSSGNAVTGFGDGADGPGTRVTALSIVSLPANASKGATSMTLASAVPANWDNTSTSYDKSIFTNDLAYVILSPGDQAEEKVPVSAASRTTIYFGQYSATASGPAFTSVPYSLFRNHPSTDNPPILETASGRIVPTYLPDTMKFQWDTSSQPAQPVLLDHWGGVIQYFARCGPTGANRLSTFLPNGLATPLVNSSATAPAYTPTAGPLYGYCTPRSIEYPYNNNPTFPVGGNAIWDSRDGALNANNPFNSWYQSPGPLPNNQTLDPSLAFKWMLGDDDGDNFIGPNETLRYDGPFILISAGPTGILCNFLTLPANPTSQQKMAAFTASGNIYNFSR